MLRAPLSYFFLLLFSLTSTHFVRSQNDSLDNLLKSAPHDSVRARLANDFSARLVNSDVKSGIYYGEQALKYARQCKSRKLEALGDINLSYSIFYSGNSDSAIKLNNIALGIARQTGDSGLVAMALNRNGYALRQDGDLAGALGCYNEALRSNTGDTNILEAGFTYLNIGLIYHDKKDYANALKNEELGLKYYREAGDEVKEANALARIGNVWLDKLDSNRAVDYYKQSLTLFEKNGHLRGVGICLNNLAMIYDGRGEHRKGLDYYFRALAIRKKIGDKNGTAIVSNNIGAIYESMNMYDSALYYMQASVDLANEINYKDMLSTCYQTISHVHEKMGDYEAALAYFKLYKDMEDTIMSDKTSEQLNELNTQFETKMRDKKIVDLTHEGELKAKALNEEQQKNILMIVAIVLLLGFAGFVWRSAILSRRANVVLEQQKKEIATQKKIVEEQHHDILDSITYAQRIQHAVLPSNEDRVKLFPQSFVFYRPRDIVSGDFWWISNSGGMKLIAAGDCTGHGVPGAFMSLIGNTLLNEIVNEKKITDPGIILNQLSIAIGIALKQKETENPQDVFSSGNVKDGMDIALCAIDPHAKMLFFAGANNPLVYTKGNDIFEMKGDRQPIGYFDADRKPFTVHTIPLAGIDMIYLFSDGFADQFGGADGKKFKLSRLKEELLSISKNPVSEQERELVRIFDQWKGSIEQIDDVCVVGIRV